MARETTSLRGEALFLIVLLFFSHLSTSHQLLLLELLMQYSFSLDSTLLYPCPCPAVSYNAALRA
jgi:hypothetical protein